MNGFDLFDDTPLDIPDHDPFNDTLCAWLGCAARDNPYEDKGWCFWLRKYRWIPEGFFCPEHNAELEEGVRTGRFKDWPVVDGYIEDPSGFVPLESREGQRILRATDAVTRRAGFRLVEEE